MYQKLRRILAYPAIKNFLERYLPVIGLGLPFEFKCEDFWLGQYRVITSRGNYRLTFFELIDNAKSFKLWINDDADYLEVITFSITGFAKFKIRAERMLIDRLDKREVIDLQYGTSKLYKVEKISEKTKVNYIEFRKPVLKSNYVDIETVLKASKKIR